jgi:hypothetical protein
MDSYEDLIKQPIWFFKLSNFELSCCAENGISEEEILKQGNELYPTGYPAPWRIVKNDNNPRQCSEDESRKHWDLIC